MKVKLTPRDMTERETNNDDTMEMATAAVTIAVEEVADLGVIP